MNMADVKTIKIKSVKHIGVQDVYNMEVYDHHNFSVNGGLIVHNCGYGLVAWHAKQSVAKEPEQKQLPQALQSDKPKGKGEGWLVW